MSDKKQINWASILALIISAIALVTAVKSYTVTEKSHQLS
jgi:hypothetical protein